MTDVTPPFGHAKVRAVFDRYPPPLRADLLRLRALIFDTAAGTDGVGLLTETLKWGQPAYLPTTPRTGSTIRIDALKNRPGGYAMFFHCQTTLVEGFRHLYGEAFDFEGNRALLFEHGKPLPTDALRGCIALALTYHARRRRLPAAS